MKGFAVAMNHPIHSVLGEAAPAFEDGAISPGLLEIVLFQLSLPLFLLVLASFLQLKGAGGTILLKDLARLSRRGLLNPSIDLVQARLFDVSFLFQGEWRILGVPLGKCFVDGKVGWVETRARVDPDPPQVVDIDLREGLLQQLVARRRSAQEKAPVERGDGHGASKMVED